MISKIKSCSQLQKILADLKNQGQKIVFTNGCFDLLHVGHARYLQEARDCGDLLVVAVNSDASVRGIKGEKRPLIPENERAEMIAALEMVDYVTIFEELDPGNIIKELQPHILVKGGDWSADKIIGRETVEAAGGKVVLIPPIPDSSTTDIIGKVIARYGEKN